MQNINLFEIFEWSGPLFVALRAIQQISFTANLDRARNTTVFLVVEEARETALDFSQGNIKVL